LIPKAIEFFKKYGERVDADSPHVIVEYLERQVTPDFHLDEFKCSCCGKVEMETELIRKLQKARDYAKIPFYISSGYRCESHNKAVGGKSDSSHLKGLAADISINYTNRNAQRFVILDALLFGAGFRRVGVAERFIHVDIDTDKPQDVCWLY
jgi:uncharacterized protein YcbK (DUF882 family)